MAEDVFMWQKSLENVPVALKLSQNWSKFEKKLNAYIYKYYMILFINLPWALLTLASMRTDLHKQIYPCIHYYLHKHNYPWFAVYSIIHYDLRKLF